MVGEKISQRQAKEARNKKRRRRTFKKPHYRQSCQQKKTDFNSERIIIELNMENKVTVSDLNLGVWLWDYIYWESMIFLVGKPKLCTLLSLTGASTLT
jgi:hypothetical protein